MAASPVTTPPAARGASEVTTLVSLIICTRNRGGRLKTCLDYVSRLEDPPGGWQLVLVDNGSSDTTPDVIREFAGAPSSCPVIAVHQPAPGLSRARNAGLARATGDICTFTDDDCYVRPDFLSQVHRVFEASTAGYLGGRVILHDPTDAPVTIKDVLTSEVIQPRRFLHPGTIHGANMAVRRDVLKSIGGFDPLLGPGTRWVCDDIEFLARACWAGWTGVYDPRPVVEHHHRRKAGSDVQRVMKGYEYGTGAYYMKGVLNPTSRIVYLREWTWRLRAHFKQRRIVSPLRELVGSITYLLTHLSSRERIPRF
jgi:glycosyltransferase involved in cell wall biosynthesis